MPRKIGYLIYLLAVLNGFAVNLSAAETHPKMCWAHYVGWGMNFDKIYDPQDLRIQLYDRTLLGKWVATNTGLSSTRKLQILSAMQYGVDGFCVDVIIPKGYMSLGSLYKAAEGLPFKVALCVDGFRGNESIKELDRFFKAYGKHPNNYFIDGRPVVFVYKPSCSPQECQRIVDELKARGHNPYWLIQPTRENTLWNDQEKMAGYLKVFDGLYDFGSNGITPEKMQTRLENGRKALKKYRPDGILCGGITQGYLGPYNGFYRPFLNTQTLRDNWDAAIKEKVDWVCLTTWNDYIESTHFEPSVWNRDVLLRINQEYLRKWKNEPIPDRFPQVYISYKEEACMGYDWTLEVLSFPYTTAPATCRIRLTDFNGKILKEFTPVSLPKNSQLVRTFRMPAIGLDGKRNIRVWACVTDDDKDGAKLKWKSLYPVVVRPGSVRSMRTMRIALDEILDVTGMGVKRKGKNFELTSYLKGWSWVGKAELLRNGKSIESIDIAKFGGMEVRVNFTVTPEMRRYPNDVFMVRFTRADQEVGWSKPVVISDSNEIEVEIPVIVRGADIDEGWFDKQWIRPWRLKSSRIYQKNVNESEVFAVHLPMTSGSKVKLTDVSGWNWVNEFGSHPLGYGVLEQAKPSWSQGKGPFGRKRKYLSFDGKADRVGFPIRSMPFGPVTVEAWIRPAKNDRLMYIFSDQNGGIELGIDKEGHLFAARKGRQITAPSKVKTGAWVHVAGCYDGKVLELFVNGKKVAAKRLGVLMSDINSIPFLGGCYREVEKFSDFYEGDIAGFALTARPLSVEEFVLLKNRKEN